MQAQQADFALVAPQHDGQPVAAPLHSLQRDFQQRRVHMAIVVSEYGKVLGLVTMDDLLAQIFGVMRDERSELQLSNPGIKLPANRGRTPAPGVPINEEVTPPAVDIDELRKRGEGN